MALRDGDNRMKSGFHDRFLRLIAQGGGHLDWAAIRGLAAQDAGEAAR
jgi:hypothetical protein